MTGRNAIFLALTTGLTLAAGAARADALTDEAKALLEHGRGGEAYERLAAVEPERAGDPDYDLLLGLAALEAGRNTNAVFALERVLAVQPGNARARAEIARAYLALGETQGARREFETVKTQPVPDAVKATIDRLLSAIERIEEQGRTVLRGFAELTMGYDTNVNAGPSSDQVAVPAFGGAVVTLAPTGVRLEDSFTTLAGGLSLRSPLARNLDLTASLTGNKRINGTYDIYDTGGADGTVGLAYTQDRDVLSLGYQMGTLFLDNGRFRDSSGLTGQWQRNFDSRNQASVFLQHGWLRYPSQDIRDADRTVYGINYAHALGDRKTVFYGGVYAGDERETKAYVPHLGHRLVGLRVGAQNQIRSDAAVFVNLGYEDRRYGGPDPIFLANRQDEQVNFGIGLVWNVAPSWRVVPQFSHTRNDSNIPINAYKRDVLSVSVRRDF